MPTRVVLLVLLGLGLSACAAPEDESAPVEAGEPAAADPLHQLTRVEYSRTVRDLLPRSVAGLLGEQLWRVPNDTVAHGYDTMNVGASQPHIAAWFAIAERLAAHVAEDPERRSELHGCLGDENPGTGCARDFIETFGRRAFRRPLSDDEVDRWLSVYELGSEVSGQEGLELVLLGMLQSPHFLYRLELGGEPIDGRPGTFRLTSYEQMARLSYALLGSTPPDAFLSAAAQVPSFTGEQLASAAHSLLADTRFRDRVGWFFEQWFDIAQIPDFPYPIGFVGDHLLTGLTDGIREEVRRFLSELTFDEHASFHDLMTARRGVLTNANQSTIYGVGLNASDGDGWYDVQDHDRAGLLTLPGIMKGSGEFASPVLRGVFVLRKLMCDPIDAPPFNTLPDDAAALPQADGSMTNRQRWTRKTSPATCQGCHARIDPFGFALEAYDTLGRYRTEEDTLGVLWETGGQIVPIDDAATVQIDGEWVAVHGAVELAEALAASTEVQRCVARQWFRFAMGRQEAAADAETLDILQASVAEQSLVDVMKMLVQTRAFQERGIGEEAP